MTGWRLRPAPPGAGRPLPMRCSPVSGESFASFVTRLCAYQPRVLKMSVTTMLARIGLLPQEDHRAFLPGYGLMLSPEHLSTFARVTRLDEQTVAAMLLTHYVGICVTLPDLNPASPDFARRAGLGNWAYLTGTHVGPCCLAQPAATPWPDGDPLARAGLLAWKLPWSFLCLTHGRFLLGVCPGCGQRPGDQRMELGAMPRFRTHAARPGICMNPASRHRSSPGVSAICGYDLTQAPTTAVTGRRLLDAQRTVNQLLAGEPLAVAGELVAPSEVFGHLRSLVSLILHVAQPGDLGQLQAEVDSVFADHVSERDWQRAARREEAPGRKGTSLHPYKAPPTDPLLLAATVPLALDILVAGDLARMGERLAPLAARTREVKGPQARQLARYFHLEGPLATAYDACLADRSHLRRRLGRDTHARPTYAFTPDHVPPELWPEVYRERFAPLLAGSDLTETSGRRFVSMVLVQLVSTLDRVGAAQTLGLPPSHAAGLYNKAIGVVRSRGHTAAFDTQVRALASELSARVDRVDYRARRRALTEFRELTPQQWAELGLPQGAGTPTQRRNAAAWVWSHLTLQDPKDSPALASRDSSQRESLREVYRRFRDGDLQRLRPALKRLAEQVQAGLG
ncbi:TniQ family protein [Deinococcus sp. Arct2-2]|uniref:TniQ family protein n=1 Tax=Deinococcus sp. Arct2-2 TaxID=2568653 RepID=UPI001454C0D8|nr:TniQ family protein [Deinococcus sp. Arct2-2]